MELDVVNLDVIQTILKSPVAVGSYRGQEVYNLLGEQVKSMNNSTLLVIDIRKANPLQYNFCEHAFGPLLKMFHKNESETIPTLFRMCRHHQACFFRGVLKNIDNTLQRNHAENSFVDAGLFTMIRFDENNEIKYVSKLSTLESDILYIINVSKSITARDIIKAKADEESAPIIDALRSLNKKGFIIRQENNSDHYHSIYKYLNIK